MKGSEFIRKIKRLGRKRGIKVKYVKRRGKGSHGTLFYDKQFTIVCGMKNELKKGTLKAMLKQLNLEEELINNAI